MDKTVVSFYYQGYGLLIFNTCSNLFQSHTNAMGLFQFDEGVTIFEGNRRSDREESLLKEEEEVSQQLFCSCSRCVKIETATAAYETTKEA